MMKNKATYIPEGQEHQHYCRKLGQYAAPAPLTPATVTRAQTGDQDAQLCVVASCMRIILSRFKRYCAAADRNRYAEDMISSGVVGILTALDRFDPVRGKMSFEVFCAHFVEREMINYLCEMDAACRLPRRTLLALREHMAAEATSADETASRVTMSNGITMTDEVARYIQQLCHTASLDAMLDADMDPTTTKTHNFARRSEKHAGLS